MALVSHLRERRVARRMAQAAAQVLTRAGLKVRAQEVEDDTAPQPGAALTLVAQLEGGGR